MRPRLALLLGALLVPALPLLVAAPAHAAGVICVNMGTACPAGAMTATTIPNAITAATSGTTIQVGPGTYSDGPYVLPPGVSLIGSGAGTGATATVLSLAQPGQTVLTATNGTVSTVRVAMTTGNGATGIAANGAAIIDNVVVFGAGATSSTGIAATGAVLQDATVNVTGGAGNTAVDSSGGNVVTDSTWNGGQVGYRSGGATNSVDHVSRVTVSQATTAVSVVSGTLQIDDSVLDLGGTGSAGLVVRPTTAVSATAGGDFLTVVNGAAGSRGVAADASAAGTHTSNLTLTSSIVRGPATSLAALAGSGGGTANFTATTSDYQTKDAGVTTDATDLVGADPAFVDPAGADYDLRAGSPVIDKGASTTLTSDRAGSNRSFDGNRDGIATPDMGAFELTDVTAPTTTITAGPSGATNDSTPVFSFRSGPDATFECQVDGSAFQPCGSPATTTPLPDGPHTFVVRAHDSVFNYEANPPRRTFTVDTVAPDTAFTKKAPKRFYKARVKVKVSSTEVGAKFQCQLDGGAWRSCRSPYRFDVKVGKHVLLVRAVDAAGNQDATPVREKFRRLPRPKRHHHHHR